MEKICVVAAACCAAVAAFVFVQLGMSHPIRQSGVGRSATKGLAQRCLTLCEVIGHKPAIIRLMSFGHIRAWIDRLLPCLASYGVVISEYGAFVLVVGICGACSLIGALASASVLGAPVGLTLAIIGFASVVGKRDRQTISATVAQMPEVLRALSGALGAGKSLPQAIEYIGRTVSEPLASEFLRASFEIEGGRSVEEAIRGLCDRVEAPGMELLGTALQISQRTGSPLSDLFARTSKMVSSSVTLRRELTVKTSQARLSAHVVAAVPVVIVCVLVLISPDYRAGLLMSAGRACLCIAAMLDIAALLLVRSLMKKALR